MEAVNCHNYVKLVVNKCNTWVGVVLLTGENQSTGRKICPIVILCKTYSAWTLLRSNRMH